ncbi:MAG: BlaI/MecI/CopY family transcriptional regulator [Planctomycetota bacterium]
MGRNKSFITEAERGILEILWARSGATIRDVADALHGTASGTQYRTVQCLLERLEKKGFVGRDRSSRAHAFFAEIDREDCLAQELQEVADKLSGGSLTPLLLNLAGNVSLSELERDELLELIENQKRRKKR